MDVFVPLSDPGQVSASEQGKTVTPAVAEQLARLGCRVVEIASASLSKVSDVSSAFIAATSRSNHLTK